jgi:hypothetical protein
LSRATRQHSFQDHLSKNRATPWRARYDGRLSVLTAHGEGPDALWTVVLRDHVRHTWLRIRRIEQLAPDAQENAPLVRWERPLTELEALAEPEGAAMTWLEVLWALGALEHSARGWSLEAIEASRPARTEPRYRLVLQRAGIRYEADSYVAFEQIVAAG